MRGTQTSQITSDSTPDSDSDIDAAVKLEDGRTRFYQYMCKNASTSEIQHPQKRKVSESKGGMYFSGRQLHTSVVFALKRLRDHAQTLNWQSYYTAQETARIAAHKQNKPRAGKLSGDTVKSISDRIDALFEMRMNGEIEKQDYDRQYKALAERRAMIEEAKEPAPVATSTMHHGLTALAKALCEPGEPTVAVIRAALIEITDYIEVPITVAGIYRDGKKANLVDHVRIVLKEPLPDGTISILSGLYKYNFKQTRHIVLEGSSSV